MALLAIPNVSEGRDRTLIDRLAGDVGSTGARVLDIHADPSHNRCVLTVTGTPQELVAAMTALAVATEAIDLSTHAGVHPYLGALDVCPIVPHQQSMEQAVETAHEVGRSIGDRAGLPVYFYGHAARPPGSRELPELRKGPRGLPDEGPEEIDPRRGICCVGARGPLIAFNVWIDADVTTARAIAAKVRASGGGPAGVRALGLWLEHASVAQVSMNLTDPDVTGIDAAFDAVEAEARSLGVAIVQTEIVGLVSEIYRPTPNKKAARLLIEPGRSLESALTS